MKKPHFKMIPIKDRKLNVKEKYGRILYFETNTKESFDMQIVLQTVISNLSKQLDIHSWKKPWLYQLQQWKG